jgi:hypothetical protein
MAKRRRARAWKEGREELELMVGRPMRLVVVADTHGRPHPNSRAQIAKLEPDAILHAGDIGDLAVIDHLAELAPTIAVRGNIDTGTTLPDAVNLSVRNDDAIVLKILLQHIAVYGPKLNAEAVRRAKSQGANLVVCGHSHVPFIGRDRDILVFNPGSIGPRRFQLPITFGIMEVSPGKVDLRHISCETGTTWLP